MTINVDLTFSDFMNKFDELGKGEWVIVYQNHKNDAEWSTFYSALISENTVSKSLEDSSWDLCIGEGLPGFSFQLEKGKSLGTYFRFSDEGVEPLVVSRNFHGIKDDYLEISEEFRFYFNLFEDRRNNKFILIDDNGDEEEVILISNEEVKIKLRLIKEFLAVKNMRLAIFFDFNRYSEKTIEELKLTEYEKDEKGNNYIYSISLKSCATFGINNKKSSGFLLGKKLISGMKNFEPKFSKREERKFIDFIIGIEDEGKEITHTCDEKKLANYFGKNKGAPYFVTPVFFRKDVLTKYYSQPDKYSVQDGHLYCGGLWGLRIDNNHPNFIMVLLGDLGHLSYKEQLHWRSFNIATEEKMSYTAWSRGFEVKFTEPENSVLFFKQKFSSFQEDWEKKFGWKFFRAPAKEDEHYFKSLHIPLTNEQKEFDEQVLALVKVFIDSLNEKELKKGLSLESSSKGIDKLEAFLCSKGFGFSKMIEFLRNLQDLRSTGVAHLKGVKYERKKTEFSISDKDLSKVFDDIIIKCIHTLNILDNYFLKLNKDQ